jgi:hypothetical protein
LRPLLQEIVYRLFGLECALKRAHHGTSTVLLCGFCPQSVCCNCRGQSKLYQSRRYQPADSQEQPPRNLQRTLLLLRALNIVCDAPSFAFQVAPEGLLPLVDVNLYGSIGHLQVLRLPVRLPSWTVAIEH